MQKTRRTRTRIKVPVRIGERWRSTRPGNSFQFTITKALEEVKVSVEEWKACWKRVQPTIPEEELFRLFEKTFGSDHNLSSKVDFIKDIVRRCQDMGEPVRECVTCLSFVSMCCVGVLLYQCVSFCILIALSAPGFAPGLHFFHNLTVY